MVNEINEIGNKIISGQNCSSLYSTADDTIINSEFNDAMSDLKFLVKGTHFPVEHYHMKPMQCIEYNPASEYAKRNPGAKPKDNWWTYLSFDYKFKDQIVTSQTLAIFGCFLDLTMTSLL